MLKKLLIDIFNSINELDNKIKGVLCFLLFLTIILFFGKVGNIKEYGNIEAINESNSILNYSTKVEIEKKESVLMVNKITINEIINSDDINLNLDGLIDYKNQKIKIFLNTTGRLYSESGYLKYKVETINVETDGYSIDSLILNSLNITKEDFNMNLDIHLNELLEKEFINILNSIILNYNEKVKSKKIYIRDNKLLISK